VKTWDVIVIGGGIIGLALAIALRKRGGRVLLVDRNEPGHEASYAAAGMLADRGDDVAAVLRPLANASAQMYPEFVHELQDESGVNIDLRDAGTLWLSAPTHVHEPPEESHGELLPAPLPELEPALAETNQRAHLLQERSVDPRALVAAAVKSAKHRSVDIASGTAVAEVTLYEGRASGVRTDKTMYAAATVVNCAGAWSGQLPPHHLPTRPVKGQMLAVVTAHGLLRHVIRAPEVYLVPRTDGRILIGSTVEEAGFDKRTDADTIQRLHEAAIAVVPALAEAKMLEAWAGLRPGTPDDLPILGATRTPGYLVATGHFRDGILLAPITAAVMAQVIAGGKPEYDISTFSPQRFG
jgi:glycine oxidase